MPTDFGVHLECSRLPKLKRAGSRLDRLDGGNGALVVNGLAPVNKGTVTAFRYWNSGHGGAQKKGAHEAS